MGLILHCGAREVAYEELKDIAVTDRVVEWTGKDGMVKRLERSDQWKGIQHYDMASTLVDSCNKLGMYVDQEKTKWGVTDDNSGLFGYLKFKREYRPNQFSGEVYQSTINHLFNSDITPALGIRHSNRSLFSAQATIGADVTVCDNMMISGTIMFKRKHTIGVDLESLIYGGLLTYMKQAPSIYDVVEKLKQIPMETDAQVGGCYKRLVSNKVCTWSAISNVDKLYHNPPHEEFKEKTAWSMYNAVTEVAKSWNPTRQMESITKLADVMGV